MRDGGDEAGSTLLLVPSAILVLFLLTALAVDGAATFLAQRQLADACAGAVNDAATAALDVDRLYRSGGSTQEVDPDRAATIARGRVAPLEARWGRAVEVRSDVVGPDVTLRLEADVPLPVGPGGASRPTTRVTATCASSTVRR